MGDSTTGLTLVLISGYFAEECERSRSRTVQKVIQTDLLPVYESLKAPIPTGCIFQLSKTRFYQQEELKFREHPTKFVCHVCGKSFYEERFIDLHMINRHDNVEYRGADVMCLADYCDVFRCDVISGHHKPRYWDKALCKDGQLQEPRDRCQMLIDTCVDKSLEEKDRKALTNAIEGRVCRYLDCDIYWDIPRTDVNPVNTAMYVMIFMLVCIALMIYYYIAYTHFYTEDSLLDSLHDKPSARPVRYPRVPIYQNIRHRANAR